MKNTFTLIIIFSALLFNVSCNEIPLIGGREKVTPKPLPETPSKGEIEDAARDILAHAFMRCPIEGKNGEDDDANIVYAYFYDDKEEKAYILELRDLRYEPTPEIPGPTDAEKLDKDLAWRGFITPTASITSKYDILNSRWSTTDGLDIQLPEIKIQNLSLPKGPFLAFPFSKEKGKWKCELCEQYSAIDCKTVQKFLKQKN